MLSEQSLSFEKQEVSVIICQGIPYFQASTVTAVLGYADSRQAVRKNVFKDYVLNLTELRLEAGTPLGSTRPMRLKAVSKSPTLHKRSWNSSTN